MEHLSIFHFNSIEPSRVFKNGEYTFSIDVDEPADATPYLLILYYILLHYDLTVELLNNDSALLLLIQSIT